MAKEGGGTTTEASPTTDDNQSGLLRLGIGYPHLKNTLQTISAILINHYIFSKA